MYLKSLVLKGFKSFADRSALTLEPGITAVVGPNGSGKSNISDAVLWVLGERNAKHLRGQAMEDVIFAGSSARKATGLAEVELVLDNSDGTLPVDYSEVSLTRRMYRSGESEYLINGVLARRMDVLDILHDTGLGTGTHSIISQGNLDSILQSKPEERRALIEEAAGVLKHKQRKQKSERKLAQMETHLTRVRDVVGEVQRQLGPLERKAKKALTYQELSVQLSEAELQLSVDDLRKLQAQWDKAKETEASLQATLDERRGAIEAAEAVSREIQERIRLQSVDAGELSKQHRLAASAVERFESASMVIRERRRAAQNRCAEIALEMETLQANRTRAEAELNTAQDTLAEVSTAKGTVDARVEALQASYAEVGVKRRGLEQENGKLDGDLKRDEPALESARRKRAQTQEALTNGLAHVKVVEGHAAELELSLARAKADAEEVARRNEAAQEILKSLADQEETARKMVGSCLRARDEARSMFDEAREAENTLNARIGALEEIEKAAAQADGQARGWLEENKDGLGIDTVPLSHAITAPPEFDGLIETLLGEDIDLLLVDDPAAARRIALALEGHELSGEVTVMPRNDSSVRDFNGGKRPSAGTLLIERLDYAPENAEAIEALLGDVVICDNIKDAQDAHRLDTGFHRFVTRSGEVVWPSGKTTVGRRVDEAEEGVLARVRHISELKAALTGALQATAKARTDVEAAEESLRNAQTASLELSQKLAVVRGDAESARSGLDAAQEKLSAIVRELEAVQKQKAEAEAVIADAKPDVESLDARIVELEKAIEQARRRREEIAGELNPLRREAGRLSEELSAAKLEAAKLAERDTYARRVCEGRRADLEAFARRSEEAASQLRVKQVSAKRLEPLLALIEELEASARRRTVDLEDRADAARLGSSSLHDEVNRAADAVHNAHKAFDEVNESLSAARVEKGRLELQVETAVSVIVDDCHTPLETAFSIAEPEDRAQLEADVFALRRRISNLGTINPDAAEEFDQLKARYDYLSGQLADLDSARRSLAKINRVIDRRMREDFITTFEQVNENFREIFSILFPGGNASLSLVDPDDVENSGVEVSAQPRGKRITKMMLMSGGEKSLTALALLFAVYRTRSTPFYILDEVEAALDDSNLRRLVNYISKLRDDTQLIMITHQRRTMEMADVLFGVSMQGDGVTKVISQKLERALEYAE